MSSPQADTAASNGDAGVQQPAFVPRVFPPPALSGIPMAYIISKLHQLGPQYWQKLPHTADCTLIIPSQDNRRRSQITAPSFDISQAVRAGDPLTTGPFAINYTSDNRRSSMPNMGSSRRRLTLRLHQDYLCAQSTFLRQLFSGASALDLTSASRFVRSSPESAPRLLPSPPGHPIVHLPLPDPTSFPHILWYLYMGDTAVLDRALSNGSIKWEGVARNAEYLGLRAELKVFLGRWFARWQRGRSGSMAEVPEEDLDEDDDSDSIDDDEETAVMWEDDTEVSEGVDEKLIDTSGVLPALAEHLEAHVRCSVLPPLVIPT